MQGKVHSIEAEQPSERKLGQSYFDCFVMNPDGQGVRVRVVSSSDQLPRLEKDDEIIIRNCKINSNSEALHADLSDLCEIGVLGRPVSGYPEDLVDMVVWRQ